MLKVRATDPTVNDDTDRGFSVQDKWLNSSTGIEFTCLNNGDGVADWRTPSGQVSGETRKVRNETANLTMLANMFPEAYVFMDSSGGVRDVELPDISTVNNGSTVFVKRQGANNVTVSIAATPGTDTIDGGAADFTLSTDNDCVTLVADTTNSDWAVS